ncbi:MAG TPA: hypothetical protein VKW76_02210 [Candidatus Binatia bacterium]|nr:hypothetical protein [Candidatus Binatia bacterium]
MSRMRRRAAVAWLWLFVLARAGSVGEARAQPSEEAIAFVHEDSGSTDPLRQIFNLRLMDARDPGRQLTLTRFATAPTLVENLAWSRDFRTIAFASNVGNGLRSLEEESIYAIDVDGTHLRPLTGFGLLADLPGPTGGVVGRIVAPTLPLGDHIATPTVTACVVSAQGASVTTACDRDGSFRLDGVPVGSAWLRAQADVEYFDPSLGVGPGLSFGFAPIEVHAGQVTDARDVSITPAIAKSIYPSWAPGDARLLASDRVRSMVLRQNPDTGRIEWVPTRGGTLVVWDLSGAVGPRPIVLPGPADVADLSGGDWSPVADRIACAANGTIGGRSGSFVLLVNPDGTAPNLVYASPLPLLEPIIRVVLQAVWSPDGQQLAVVESATDAYDPTRGRSDILVMNADGSAVHPVTASIWGEFAGGPSWSPDGQTLAYHVAIMPSLLTMIIERSDLFAVRRDGSGVLPLSSDGRSSQPAWRSGGLPPMTTTTTTTLPCTTARCTIDAGLHGPECGDEIVPAAIGKKLNQAMRLIERAAGSPRKKAKRLFKQAKRLLKLAGKAAGKAARGRKPKLTKDCAGAIQRASSVVGSGLPT